METFANMLWDLSLNTTYLIINILDEYVTNLLKLLNFITK